MSATPPLTHAEQEAEMLGNLASRGKIGGQVPHQIMQLAPETTPGEYAAEQRDHDATLTRLIQNGTAAWKVANPGKGRADVLYTDEPRNPQTGRIINSYLWMTPLAVVRYGAEIYAQHVAFMSEQKRKYPHAGAPMDRAEFDQTILLDTVPVAPKFASLVPAAILAATVPAPKPKKPVAKASKTPQGHAAILGARNSEAVAFCDASGQALLDKLDQWNVGPGTQLSGRYAESEPDTSPSFYIERAAITGAGVDGVNWLANKGFTPTADWYSFALSMEDPDCLLVMDAVKALGADPKSRVGGAIQRTLWHDITHPGSRPASAARIDWLKAQGVDWSIADVAGELPLSGLLGRINVKMSSSDLMGSDSPLGNFSSMLRAMSNQVPGMGGLAQTLATESAQNKKEIDVLADLAVEMVESGVDPMQKALDDSYPWQHISPNQIRAQKLIHSRLPRSEKDPDGAVMREMFFGDREALRKDRAAYGGKMLAFIERMEQAAGFTFLAPDPATATPASQPAAKRPKP